MSKTKLKSKVSDLKKKLKEFKSFVKKKDDSRALVLCKEIKEAIEIIRNAKEFTLKQEKEFQKVFGALEMYQNNIENLQKYKQKWNIKD